MASLQNRGLTRDECLVNSLFGYSLEITTGGQADADGRYVCYVPGVESRIDSMFRISSKRIGSDWAQSGLYPPCAVDHILSVVKS